MTCTTPTPKICTICQLPKDRNQFTKHGGHRDGLSSNCRLCVKELVRMRREKAHQTSPDKSQPPKAVKTPKLQKPLSNGSLDAFNVEPKYNKPDRYSIVRNTSRRTGQCSWGIWDSVPYDNTNPVCYVADNLKDAILECERLNAPPAQIRYTKRGQIGFVTNDDVEDERLEAPRTVADSGAIEYR